MELLASTGFQNYSLTSTVPARGQHEKSMATKVRGVKGATTTRGTSVEDVLAATEELLLMLIEENGIEQDDIAAVQFTTSPDLVAEFPAVAAREPPGWICVPLTCGHEMASTRRAHTVHPYTDSVEH